MKSATSGRDALLPAQQALTLMGDAIPLIPSKGGVAGSL